MHPTEQQLEDLILGRFPGSITEHTENPTVSAIEDHLLICSVCLDRAQLQEHTIAVMREFLRRPAPKRERKPKVKVLTANQGWLF